MFRGLGVSLDEGVDGAHTAVSLGGVVGGGLMVSGGRGCVWRWNVSFHSSISLSWMFCLSLKFERVHQVRIYLICRNLVCESWSAIGGLGRSVGRSVMDRLLGSDMVVVKVMLSVTLIAIVPLQLGLECVVLL